MASSSSSSSSKVELTVDDFPLDTIPRRKQYIIPGRYCLRHPRGGVRCPECIYAGISHNELQEVTKKLDHMLMSCPVEALPQPKSAVDIDKLRIRLQQSDKARTGFTSAEPLQFALVAEGLDSKLAVEYVTGFYRLTSQQIATDLISYQEFVDEYSRLMVFKSFRYTQSVHQRYDQDGLSSISDAALRSIFAAAVGSSSAAALVDDIRSAYNWPVHEQLTIEDVALWYLDKELQIREFRRNRKKIQSQPPPKADGLEPAGDLPVTEDNLEKLISRFCPKHPDGGTLCRGCMLIACSTVELLHRWHRAHGTVPVISSSASSPASAAAAAGSMPTSSSSSSSPSPSSDTNTAQDPAASASGAGT